MSQECKQRNYIKKLLSNEGEQLWWLRLGINGLQIYFGGRFNHTTLWIGCCGEGKINQG